MVFCFLRLMFADRAAFRGLVCGIGRRGSSLFVGTRIAIGGDRPHPKAARHGHFPGITTAHHKFFVPCRKRARIGRHAIACRQKAAAFRQGSIALRQQAIAFRHHAIDRSQQAIVFR